MKIFIILALLCFPLFSFGQYSDSIGRSVEEVYEAHQTAGGISVPTLDTLPSKAIIMNYKITNDEGTGKKGFFYTFKNNKCSELTVIIEISYLQQYKNQLNKKYQYLGNDIWLDNKNHHAIKVQEDKNAFFMRYVEQIY